jgi:hypothetical protein
MAWGRRIAGAVVGGIVAGLVMAVIFIVGSIALGIPALTVGYVFGWAVGYTALDLMTVIAGMLAHLVVSIVGAQVFLGIVAGASRRNLGRLSFTTYGRAALLGVIFGFVMWLVYWIPMADFVLIPAFQSILGMATWTRVAPAMAAAGFVTHLVYGAVFAVIIFAIGGPIPSGTSRPVRPPGLATPGA